MPSHCHLAAPPRYAGIWILAQTMNELVEKTLVFRDDLAIIRSEQSRGEETPPASSRDLVPWWNIAEP